MAVPRRMHRTVRKSKRPWHLWSGRDGKRLCWCAGASAFEWQQEIGLNQARRTGEVADMDALLAFAVAETQAAAALGDGSSQTAQPEILMAQVGARSLQSFQFMTPAKWLEQGCVP